MDVRPVDPRDIEIEVDAPVYRVYFWKAEAGVSTEYELSAATDVHEAIAWADENAGPDRTYVLYARVDRTLVRLSGTDPTTTEP
jgi:hypothetical protein